MSKYKSKRIPLALISILVILFLIVIYENEEVGNDEFYTEEGALISIFIQNEDGEYEIATTEGEDAVVLFSALGEDYTLNTNLSSCENGVLNYDRDTNSLSISVEDSTSSETTRCNLYFFKSPIVEEPEAEEPEVEEPLYLYQQILIDNGEFEESEIHSYENAITNIKNKDTPDFSSVATTNEGMFATEDIDSGTTYYFRGAVDDNWVKFGGYYWRIIRINEDNDIKMIYSGTTKPSESQSVVMTGSGTYVTTSRFATMNTGIYAWYVGYVYTAKSAHGSSTDSVVKGKIDTWFDTNLSSYKDDYLVQSYYCVDRAYETWLTYSITGFYAPYIRLYNDIPSLLCTYASDEISLYAGMISSDEASIAGLTWGEENDSNYLYTGGAYWTLSPAGYLILTNGATLLTITADGDYGIVESYSTFFGTYQVRPTVTLEGELTNFSGSGTWDDPYTITS